MKFSIFGTKRTVRIAEVFVLKLKGYKKEKK